MHVSDTCIMNYCRAKEAKEKFKIQTEFKILGNEVKVKSKQAKKALPGFIQKEKQQIYQKPEKIFALLSMWKVKSKSSPWFLKHNDF